MTAREIVIRRTTLEADEASTYVRMAESRVRSYLHYDEDDDLSGFSSVVADIAILMWDEDKARRAAEVSKKDTDLSSESFSEGGVSVRKDYRSGYDVAGAYEDMIAKKLSTLSGFIKITNDMQKVRFI